MPKFIRWERQTSLIPMALLATLCNFYKTCSLLLGFPLDHRRQQVVPDVGLPVGGILQLTAVHKIPNLVSQMDALINYLSSLLIEHAKLGLINSDSYMIGTSLLSWLQKTSFPQNLQNRVSLHLRTFRCW